MNILIINGHPDSGSFVSALFNTYSEKVNKDVNEVKVLDLSKMKFDPVLRFGLRKRMDPDNEIELSQELIKWTDHFVIFYPIWFGTVPSLLKGWFERVFTPGIAYNMNGFKITKLLKGKTAHLVISSGSPVFWQIITGNIELKMVKRFLAFCGIKTTMVDRIGLVDAKKIVDERRNRFLEHIGKRAQSMK